MKEPSHLEGEAEITGAPRIDIVLAPQAPSVGEARHAVGALLHDFPHVPILVIEDVLLLVSELVTNAVLHAGTDLRVTASVQAGLVSVSVGDGDPLHAPVLAARGPDATSGRGVMLVNALASDWGVELDEGWKVVWFQASYEPGAAAEPQVTPTRSCRAGGSAANDQGSSRTTDGEVRKKASTSRSQR